MDIASRAENPSLGRQLLRSAALVYAVGFVAHTADHVRRGIEVLTPEVLWAGSISGVVAILAIVLALAGHRFAPAVAVAHGLTQAIGVAAVHLIPARGPFSDAIALGGADAITWAAVLIEIAGALAFGLAGVYVLFLGVRGAPPARAVARPTSRDAA